MYRLAVFDIDGTLIDTERTGVESLMKTIRELTGKEVPYGEAYKAFGIPSSVPAWSIYVSFMVCVFIGVLFGYIPAQKAANMDPIEAIRHE